jgi:hypothetical protein
MTGGTNEGAEKNDDRGVDEVHGGDDWTEGENCLFFNISGAGTLIPGSRPLKSALFPPTVQHPRRGNVNPRFASTEVARKYLLLLGCGILALSRKDELLQPLVFS